MGAPRILQPILSTPMPLVHVTLHTPQGAALRVPARTGHSLMQAAVAAGVEGIAADCGGSLSCATCHVIVAPEWLEELPPPSPDELAMLEMTAAPREPGSRLSCQIEITLAQDGLQARLPATQY